MTNKTAPQTLAAVAAAPDPRLALLGQVFEKALPRILNLRNGEKCKLEVPGSELEMLRLNETGVCFMLDIAFPSEAT